MFLNLFFSIYVLYFSHSFWWGLLFASSPHLFSSFLCSAALYYFLDVQIIMPVNINQVIRKTSSSTLTRILTLACIFKFLHNHFEHFSLYKLHSYNSFFVFYENIFFCLFSNIFCYSCYKIIINLLNFRCSV